MSEGKIHAAICGVMADVGAVSKNDRNEFDKYKYRGIDAVMNALYPAMVKNHVFVTPTVLEATREDRVSRGKQEPLIYSVLKVKYTFYTDDGSSVDAIVVGEALDRSDKSTNKAMSAAYKYACFQTFCIPTEEFIDADKETIEVAPKNAAQATTAPSETTLENDNQDMSEDGYPGRAKMIALIVSKFPAGDESTQKMLEYFHIDSLADLKKLKDVQLKTLYNRAVKK